MRRWLRPLWVALVIAIGLSGAVKAASVFPTPNFTQVAAGLTTSGGAVLPIKANADVDGVTGHAVYDCGNCVAGWSLTSAIAASTSGPTILLTKAGKLGGVLVTANGTASETFYDNASACSGTIVGVTPTSVSAGSVITFSMPVLNGITACGAAGSPALTVAFGN